MNHPLAETHSLEVILSAYQESNILFVISNQL